MPTADHRATSPIRVVLFDMGGVLVELGPLDQLLGVAMPPEEFWPRWLGSPAVRAYERGTCDTIAFTRSLAAELDLPLSPDDLTERFRGFTRGLYPGAAELVREVAAHGVATGVLSNTNALHWDHQIDGEILRSLFDHEFLSYRLGLVKPDRELFEAVVATLGLNPVEILVLDDNELNVAGARAAGLEADHTRGVPEARRALHRRGLLAGRGPLRAG
ncbi:MAG: HAD family phosphatase [Acidimicrobiia bacterium]|nr:HAD family phosphatase [Acidimicrobiia bacterium]MDH5288705.1 HAD family phosphatase [Acidimicrobiia bacterium]